MLLPSCHLSAVLVFFFVLHIRFDDISPRLPCIELQINQIHLLYLQLNHEQLIHFDFSVRHGGPKDKNYRIQS